MRVDKYQNAVNAHTDEYLDEVEDEFEGLKITRRMKLEALSYANDAIGPKKRVAVCTALSRYFYRSFGYDIKTFVIYDIFKMEEFMPVGCDQYRIWYPFDRYGYEKRLELINKMISRI